MIDGLQCPKCERMYVQPAVVQPCGGVLWIRPKDWSMRASLVCCWCKHSWLVGYPKYEQAVEAARKGADHHE